jgi:transcriptional regulator with XRE-family HTH domain
MDYPANRTIHLAHRAAIAGRLRLVRQDLYGDRWDLLADRLGVTRRRWLNYEEGVATPLAEVLLAFLELTGVEPAWLLTGDRERYRTDHQGQTRSTVAPRSPRDLLSPRRRKSPAPRRG